jgi:hypothetical protein
MKIEILTPEMNFSLFQFPLRQHCTTIRRITAEPTYPWRRDKDTIYSSCKMCQNIQRDGAEEPVTRIPLSRDRHDDDITSLTLPRQSILSPFSFNVIKPNSTSLVLFKYRHPRVVDFLSDPATRGGPFSQWKSTVTLKREYGSMVPTIPK